MTPNPMDYCPAEDDEPEPDGEPMLPSGFYWFRIFGGEWKIARVATDEPILDHIEDIYPAGEWIRINPPHATLDALRGNL